MSAQYSNFELRLTEKDIAALEPGSRAQVLAMLDLRQALFDILGSYPQDNVLPYYYSFSNTTRRGAAGTPNGVIAANSTVQQSIKISADSAFVAKTVRGASTGNYLIFFRMDSSDRQLMNAGEPVINTALVGTAQRPAPLEKPLLLPANTTISFDVTDISGAANDIYYTFAGFKVYNRKIQ
jgi:hypothetical protein